MKFYFDKNTTLKLLMSTLKKLTFIIIYSGLDIEENNISLNKKTEACNYANGIVKARRKF